MHATSRTWISPKVKADSKRQSLNLSRRKVCRHSPFWSLDFDLDQHRRDWATGKERENKHKLARSLKLLEARTKSQDNLFPDPPPSIRKALDGKPDENDKFKTCHSTVLSIETVFCPQVDRAKDVVAPWPTRAEMKYEGDDRISTDRLHGRFPGAPRVEGNETVNWQHKAAIEPFVFDDFLFPIPNEVDIFMRTHWIAELEIDDKEGERMLGKELMGLVDPQDQFLE
jgi:hypothetical protein